MSILDVLYTTFGERIEVSDGSDGTLYDGCPSIYQALMDDDVFADLDFSGRMMVAAAVMTFIDPPSEDGDVPPIILQEDAVQTNKTFIYHWQ